MKMKLQFPLLAKVLGWLFLHLILLGLAFFLFVRWQLGMGLDSLLSGSAGERLSVFGDAVISRIVESPLRQWNTSIKPLAKAKNVTATIYDPSGLIEFPLPVPPNVAARANSATPRQRVDPGRPGGGPGRPGGDPARPHPPGFEPPDRPAPPPPGFGDAAPPPHPDGAPDVMEQGIHFVLGSRSRPNFLIRADNGDGYWAGVLLHLPPVRNLPRQPIMLLIRADRLDGSGMFFDIKPWLWGGLAVLLLSLAFWTPFVWRITRYLQHLRHAADHIAAGQFHVSLPPRGNDELGNLGRTIEGMAARLELLIAGQKRFLGDAAHELCAPLARIRTGLGILEMKLSTQDITALASIEADTAELANLVDEILAFSRSGKRSTDLRPVAVENLVREVLAREAAADIDVSIPSGLTVMSDPLLLGRALGNLIRNAFVHAGPQAKVSILATEAADSVAITVADDGPGVPAAEISRIFEPFYRLDRSRSRDTGGNGLGLAIVRSAIISCGGQTVASLPESGGFAVTISLPRTLLTQGP